MRKLLIFAPLAMLLLSCEPGQENADAGNIAPHGKNEKSDYKLPANVINPERLAAQDSVGKPPLPRNLLGSIEDICPVHHQKMKVREIPIVFKDTASAEAESASPSASANFPFGAEKIVSAGNALLPSESLTARVYQCPSCIAERKAAEQKRVPSAPSTASK